MKRKIIRQGHNTLTITLPSEWVRKFNLKAGREIELVNRDNGLFISAERTDEDRKTEFNIDGMDIPTIWKYFMAVYREGYNEVYVRFSPDIKLESPYKFFAEHKLDLKYKRQREKETALEFMHELVNRFIGFEIVDYGDNFVLVKDLSEPTLKEFENALRRVFLLIEQMTEETCEALKTGNTKMLLHIHDVDINLDKFHDYCIRILNKICNKEIKKTSLLFSVLFILELMGDEFKSISYHLLNDFSHSSFDNIIEVAESVREEFSTYYHLFYSFDKEKIIKVSKIDLDRYFKMLEIYKTANKNEREIFHHLRMIGKYINALHELRIEMEF